MLSTADQSPSSGSFSDTVKQPSSSLPVARLNNYDTIRLIAASSVIFSHAFLFADGHEGNEPIARLLGEGYVLGFYGVVVFFVLSGYLVTQSWFTTGGSITFAIKRALRIYPALLVCAFVSAFVVAPLFSDVSFLKYLLDFRGYQYFIKTITLQFDDAWIIPGTFFYGPKVSYELGSVINASLWTLSIEVACYAIVLFLGLLRLLNLWSAAICLIVGVVGYYGNLDYLCWPFLTFKLFPAFSSGMLLYFLKKKFGLTAVAALLCFICLIGLVVAGQTLMALSIFGAYSIIYFSESPSVYLGNGAMYGDLSYGTYLYGWPVGQCLRYALGDLATWWSIFLLALLISFGCAWISWRFIESPMLRLKQSPLLRLRWS